MAKKAFLHIPAVTPDFVPAVSKSVRMVATTIKQPFARELFRYIIEEQAIERSRNTGKDTPDESEIIIPIRRTAKELRNAIGTERRHSMNDAIQHLQGTGLVEAHRETTRADGEQWVLSLNYTEFHRQAFALIDIQTN